MSEWAGEDIIIQKQEWKTFFSIYILLILDTIMGFFWKNPIKLWINSIGLWRLSFKRRILSYASLPIWKLHLYGEIISQNLQAHLLWQPPFSQHILWQCCNLLGILSSMVEILLFNSVFHNGVTPVSVSILKPPLRVIGVLPLKPQASLIYSVCI